MTRYEFDIEVREARDLFVTPEFKESTWVRDITDEVGLVLCTKSAMHLGHFGTYIGALPLRENENPYRADLINLHECTHLLTWYEARVALTATGTRETFNQWLRRMCISEKKASVTSEVLAHFYIPGLRQKVFTDHEIWADRFNDAAAQILNGTTAKNAALEELIFAERDKVLHSTSYDFLEAQIQNFFRQNEQWCRIWAEPMGDGAFEGQTAFRVVETHMTKMDEDIDLDAHREWLKAVSSDVQRGETTFHGPFMQQALDFEPYYLNTLREYGNKYLSR